MHSSHVETGKPTPDTEINRFYQDLVSGSGIVESCDNIIPIDFLRGNIRILALGLLG